jgi:predicted enzyme related to lactoylglutathione lyase
MTENSYTILHTVIIKTKRMSELVDFYGKGLELGEAISFGPDHMGFVLPNAYFGFDLVGEGDGVSPGAASAWFEVDDLQTAFQRFESLGAVVIYPPTKKPWGAILASLNDPDGNVFGLAQRGTNPIEIELLSRK